MDSLVYIITNIQNIAMVLGFALIAGQFARQLKMHTKSSRAFVTLVLIFALGAFNGYLLPIFLDNDIVEKIRLLTMIPLIYFTWDYAAKKDVLIIAEALRRDLSVKSVLIRESEDQE